MDNEETKDQKRVLTGSVWSNTARVIEPAVAQLAAEVVSLVVVVVAGAAWERCCSGEWVREGSGNDMDGNEDVGDEGRFSHCGDSVGSRVAAATAGGGTELADGAGRFAGAFELVVPGWFDADGGWDACACECAASATGPGESLDDDVAAVLEDARMLSLRCDTASHSLVPTLVLVSARAGPSRRPAAGACSPRSRARRSSHRARSASARVRTSALCLRHSTTCASYEALQASCSEAETETEEDDKEEGASSGDVAPGPAAAGSDGGCDSGCEGETRERSGGTEKGSESAA